MKVRLISAAILIALIWSPSAYAGPDFGPSSYASQTVGTTDSIILSAGSASKYLDIVNNSSSATICINFGATATITGSQCAAGEITLSPLWHRSWEGTFVPSDAIHAVSSAASTAVSVGAR